MAKLLIFLFILIAPSTVSATTMEYWVYDGFDPVVSSLQKLSLIFSDNGYKTLFFTIITMGIFFAGIAAYAKIATGGKSGFLSWTIPVGVGIVLYVGLVVPKGTLVVYDSSTNRFQSINGIPEAIVVLAGSLNTIERGVVDIMNTAGTPIPYDYKMSSGGIGFNLLKNTTSLPVKFDDEYMNVSLERYIKDCVFFELQRPGTNLTINKLSKSSDLLADFAEAKNPSVWTVYYTDADPVGTPLTCDLAYDAITTYLLAPGRMDNPIKSFCGSIGLNVSNATELTRCKNLLREHVSVLTNFTGTEDNFVLNRQVAEALNEVILTSNSDLAVTALANRQHMTSGLGIGLVANEWLPIIRAVITAVAFGLIPVLAFFIPTPLVGRAFSTIAGFFIWLTAWGVTDAVMHGLAVDQAVKVFEQVKQYNIGYTAIRLFPDASEKALAMFGVIRSSGIMLATVITGLLVKFGGHALAMMAGSLSGNIQSAGTKAGFDGDDPVGQTNTLKGLNLDTIPTMDTAHRFGWGNMRQATTAQMMGNTGGILGVMKDFGGIEGAADMIAKGKEAGIVQGGAKGSEMEKIGWGKAKQLEEFQASTNLHSTEKRISLYGSPEIASTYATASESALLKRQSVFQKFLAQRGIDVSDPAELKVWEDTGRPLGNGQYLKDAIFDENGHLLYAKISGTQDGRYFEQQVDGQWQVLSGMSKGAFNFNGRDLEGTISWAGGAYNFEGIDRATGQIIRMQGSASNFNPDTGKIEGWQVYHETGDKGIYDKLIMTKAEALERFKPLEGSEFYSGIQAMKNTEAINISFSRDAQTGMIATIDAKQGYESKSFDHRTKLTGSRDTHEALKVIDEGLRKTTGNKIDDVSYKKDGYYEEHHHGEKSHFYGINYNFGNDTLSMMIDGKPKILARNYSQIWYDKEMGRAFTNKIADDAGGHVKITQGIKDLFAAGWRIDAKTSRTPTGKLVAAVTGLSAETSIEGQRSAIESLDANTVKYALQNHYDKLYNSQIDTAYKNKEMASITTAIYNLGNKHATMNTGQQMITGVDNPAKKQGVPMPHRK